MVKVEWLIQMTKSSELRNTFRLFFLVGYVILLFRYELLLVLALDKWVLDLFAAVDRRDQD